MAQQQLGQQQQQQQPPLGQHPQQMLLHAHTQQPPGSLGPIAMHAPGGGYYMPMHPMHMQYGAHAMYAQPQYVVPYGYAQPQQPQPHPPPGVMFAMARMGSEAAGQLHGVAYGQQPGTRVGQAPVLAYGPPPDSPIGAGFQRLSRPPAVGATRVLLGSPLPSGELRSSSVGHMQRGGSPTLSGGSGGGVYPDRFGLLNPPRMMTAAPQQVPGAPVLIPVAPPGVPPSHQVRSAPAHDSVRVASDGGSTARIGSSLPSLISSESPSLASFSEDFAERGAHPWSARMPPPAEPTRPTCAFYLKTGTCAYGDKCKFLHPSDRIPHVQLNSLGLPVRPGETECAYYMKNMRCGFGPSCKFHHPELAVGWVPAGAGSMGPPGMIPMMPGSHGMMPAGPVPHGVMPPGMMPFQQPSAGSVMYPAHLPMGATVRVPMAQPGSAMLFTESSDGFTGGGFAEGDGGIGSRVASLNLGSRSASVELGAAFQVGASQLARSRSGNSRARGRRPARAAQAQASPDGNHVADGVQPAGTPALLRTVVLTSPFAAAAAAGSDPSLASSDENATRDNTPDAAATEMSDEGPVPAAKPAAAFTEVQLAASVAPGVRTSSGMARQEQDYAIVEAPASLRRRSSALPPQEDAAQQGEMAAVLGVDVSDRLQYKTSEGSDRLRHTSLPAAPSPSSAPPRGHNGSLARAQRDYTLGAEGVAAPSITSGTAKVMAGLELLRVSGARSGIGGTETASSTSVSFTSAAST